MGNDNYVHCTVRYCTTVLVYIYQVRSVAGCTVSQSSIPVMWSTCTTWYPTMVYLTHTYLIQYLVLYTFASAPPCVFEQYIYTCSTVPSRLSCFVAGCCWDGLGPLCTLLRVYIMIFIIPVHARRTINNVTYVGDRSRHASRRTQRLVGVRRNSRCSYDYRKPATLLLAFSAMHSTNSTHTSSRGTHEPVTDGSSGAWRSGRSAIFHHRAISGQAGR